MEYFATWGNNNIRMYTLKFHGRDGTLTLRCIYDLVAAILRITLPRFLQHYDQWVSRTN